MCEKEVVMEGAGKRQVILYTRPGCHLCEDAADLLERLAARVPLEIVEVNILEDVGLFERYKHRIPVIVISGGPTLEAPIREQALADSLITPSA